MTYYDHFEWDDNHIWVISFNGSEKRFCPLILVRNVLVDVVSEAYSLDVRFLRKNGSKGKVILPCKDLAGNFLPSLFNAGFTLAPTPQNITTLSEILTEQMNDDSVEAISSHSVLGYQSLNGTRFFFGSEDASGEIESKFSGEMPPSAKGDFETWRSGVQEFVNENPLLILPLAMGASAPVATRLKLSGDFDETLLWSLIGASSTGKTSSLKLAASPWGKPSGDGIIDNLTGTEKYFFSTLTSRNGFPCFFDETTAVRWDFTSAIYTVSLSREGGRCNPDGTPKKRKVWSGGVLFTGETSMFLNSNRNGGLYARLVEFTLPWFSNEHAPEKLCRFISKNYGTAWRPYINWLEQVDDAELLRTIDENVALLKSRISALHTDEEESEEAMKFSGIQKRIIKKLAILLTSVDFMLVAWDMNCDRELVLQTLVEVYEHNAANVDKIAEFHDDFVQYIVSHRNDFPNAHGGKYDMAAHVTARGFNDSINGISCVWVLANEFERELNKHGLDASSATLRELGRRGMLKHFGDRYKKKYKVGTLEPTCYCFFSVPTANQSTGTASKVGSQTHKK